MVDGGRKGSCFHRHDNTSLSASLSDDNNILCEWRDDKSIGCNASVVNCWNIWTQNTAIVAISAAVMLSPLSLSLCYLKLCVFFYFLVFSSEAVCSRPGDGTDSLIVFNFECSKFVRVVYLMRVFAIEWALSGKRAFIRHEHEVINTIAIININYE